MLKLHNFRNLIKKSLILYNLATDFFVFLDYLFKYELPSSLINKFHMESFSSFI